MPEQTLKEKEREEYDEEKRRKELEKRKEEKEKRGVEKAEIAKPIIQKTPKTKVKIPIIKLEEPKVEIKEVNISKDVPHIEKEKLEIRVPIVQLSSPTFEEREIELNKEIPSVGVKEKKVILPLVKLKEARVRSVISEFDSTVPKVHLKPLPRIRVPIYRVLRLQSIKEKITFFDEEIDKKLLERLEEVGRETLEPPPETPPSGGEEKTDEPVEVLESIFGAHFARIFSKGPVVVLYKELKEDSTIGSFETLCMRIFREKKGGEPGYIPIKKLDEFNIREIEKYIRPEGNIVRIDLDMLKRDAENKKKNIFGIISPEYLRETLGRFIVGDISFLIFKTRDETLYAHCKQVVGKLLKNIEHSLEIAEIIPDELSIEQKRILTEIVWGVSVEGVEFDIRKLEGDRPVGTTLDDIFNKFGKTKREKYIKKLKEEKGGLYVMATNQHDGESDLHLQIKWFIVRFLAQKYKLTSLLEIEENIKTEDQLQEANIKGAHPKPDVWDRRDNSVYEVETLFSEDSEGKTPQKKIYESIRKYEGTSVRKINIVLDNLTLLIHAKEILGIKRNLKEWENKTGKIVNFLTLDLENYKLVPIYEFFKKCKSLIESRQKELS